MKVDLKWMNPCAPRQGGATFGLPWPKGKLDRKTCLYMADEKGNGIPVQSEPRAYWPDGSVKWTLHSAVLGEKGDAYYITDEKTDEKPKAASAAGEKLRVTEEEKLITVDTGSLVCVLEKEAPYLIKSISRKNGKLLCSGGRLVAINEQRYAQDGYRQITKHEYFEGMAYIWQVEQAGPERAVIRIRGSHTGQFDDMRTTSKIRKWLTFDLRLYFYAGQDEIRLVHTFIFDGREDEDFIRGIGIEFDVPMMGAFFNRHLRFGGETGLFCESPKSLWVRQKREYDDYYKQQLEGREVLFDAQMMLNDMTEWNDFKITQLSSRNYDIKKRTGEGCVYVRGANGARALGIGYIGGTGGGMAAFKKDFWQKFPSSIEANNLLKEKATLKVWLWSPDGDAIDMRRYDNKTHVEACYEGFEEMRSSGYGVANTNEIVIKVYDKYPGNEALVDSAKEWQSTNLLLAAPEYYLETGVLGGVWSVDDRSTPGKAMVESWLDDLLEYHKNEREQRDWYGFWDYGDIGHTYDEFRHSWRYDMGGYGWQNTELVPNLWLMYGFLRSGREDYFQMAQAMCRHTAEVDLYHLGDYRGLGSRHNVIHWGCGCKEGRIGMAALHKVYYFVTGDERTGDIMDDQRDCDKAIARVDPLRAYFTPDPQFSCHMRFAPDLMAICSNWFTYWERHEDTKYRDKLMKVLEEARKPGMMVARVVFNYDPEDLKMDLFEYSAPVHFNYCFGSDYVWPEIFNALEDEELMERYYDMGQIYSEKVDTKALFEKWGIPYDGSRISIDGKKVRPMMAGTVAQAARGRKDERLAYQAWEGMLNAPDKPWPPMLPLIIRSVEGAGVPKLLTEAVRVSGNETGQWGSHLITMLAAIGDSIPEEFVRKAQNDD
ncbi:MAG: hypothetical protein ACOX8S_08750 [Christensenellales bacterium]|jgi:hypothetical protein